MTEQLMSEDELNEVRRYLETTTALADGRALGYLKRLLADRRVFERHVEAVASATLEEAAKVCEEEFERNKVPEGHAITRKQSAMPHLRGARGTAAEACACAAGPNSWYRRLS